MATHAKIASILSQILVRKAPILDTFAQVREDYSNQNHDLYEGNFQLLFTITIDSSEENFLDDYIALTFNCKPLSTPLYLTRSRDAESLL